MGKIIKGILLAGLLLVVVVAVGWVAINVYSCATNGDTGRPDMPQADEAAYTVYIENTGNLIMTNEYEVIGQEVGSRIFVLHGFWELVGQDFKYKKGDIILDEQVFGEITVRRR